MKFKKFEGNPIFVPNEKNDWESLCVLNPAVIYDDENEEFVMVYRTAGNDVRHEIKMGLATSKDGFHFERKSDNPIFFGHQDDPDGGCVEDPRIVKLGDLYYMTYAARCYAPGQYWLEEWVEGVSKPPMYLDETDVHGEELPVMAKKNITVSYLAVTKDFKRYKKFGRITEPSVDDRDVVLFPDKINGKYVIITRPKFKDVPNLTMPSIWITFTEDLMEYEKPELLMTGEAWWEHQRIGAGTPPVKTPYGWLMIYHGVSEDGTYRAGAVLLDLNDPRKIVARTKDYILEPSASFELRGFGNPCVFPTGLVIKDNTIYTYYGCADKYIGVATANYEEFMQYLLNECKV